MPSDKRREEILRLREEVLVRVAGVGRNPTKPYYSTAQMDKLADRIVALEHERDRLRAVLEAFARDYSGQVADRSRAALRGEEG